MARFIVTMVNGDSLVYPDFGGVQGLHILGDLMSCKA